MRHACRNEWCPSKVEREVQECGPCQRSAERTAALMARVEAKSKQRGDGMDYETLKAVGG